MVDSLQVVLKQLNAPQTAVKGGKGGKHAKDSSKGGKDPLPIAPCPLCGKLGHWKKDGWHNPKGPNFKGPPPPPLPASGKDRGGKGNTSDGKGGNNQVKGNCWTRGKPWHRASECPRKGVKELAEKEPEPADVCNIQLGGVWLTPLTGDSSIDAIEADVNPLTDDPSISAIEADVLRASVDSGAVVTAVPLTVAKD